jgi:hypothetical protein
MDKYQAIQALLSHASFAMPDLCENAAGVVGDK